MNTKQHKLLSLCMIAKNEADNLTRCLSSVEGIIDEIILVDTGSTDATPQIAAAFGAKVLHHPWTGSFSEARNLSLQEASGEWIMYLDADEALTDGKEHLRELLSQGTDQDGFFMSIVSFTGNHAYRDAAVNPAFRLFRNHPYCRFTRSLHEQIAIVILRHKPEAVFAHIPVVIEHFGYLNAMVAGKAKMPRNLEIARREVREDPFEGFAWHNLAVEYMRAQRLQAALYCYRRAFFHAGSLTVNFVPSVLRSMASCLMHLGRYSEALSLLHEAQEAYPDYTDLLFLQGLIHLEQRKIRDAEHDFERCLAMGESIVGIHITDEGVGSFKACFMLGECNRKSGKHQKALARYEESVRQAVARHRYYEPAIAALVSTLVTQGASSDEILARFAGLNEGSLVGSPTLAHLVARSLLKCSPVANNTLQQLKELRRGVCLAEKQDHDTEALLTWAMVDFCSRDYTEAATTFEKISLTSPEGGEAWLKGCFALALSGEGDRARRRLRELHCDGATTQAARNFYLAILDCWEGRSSPEENPKVDIASASRFLAAQLWEILNWLLQLEEFERFERTLPLLKELCLSEGATAMQLGKLYHRYHFSSSAMTELLRAVEHGVADEEALSILGSLCLHQRQYQDAEILFTEALRFENNGDGLSIYMGLAAACLAQGKTDQAELAMRGAELVCQ